MARSHATKGTTARHTPAAAGARDESVRSTLEALRRLVRALRVGTRGAKHAAGLSTAELFILQALAHGPVHSLNELADRTFTDQSSASPVVERLRRRRLLRRTRAPEDGRRVIIELTPAGRALLAGAPEPPQRTLVAALERLPWHLRHTLASGLTWLTIEMGIAGSPAAMLFEEPRTRTRGRPRTRTGHGPRRPTAS